MDCIVKMQHVATLLHKKYAPNVPINKVQTPSKGKGKPQTPKPPVAPEKPKRSVSVRLSKLRANEKLSEMVSIYIYQFFI